MQPRYWLPLVLLCAAMRCAFGNPPIRSYRVVAETQSNFNGIFADGTIQWTSAAEMGTFLVEWSTNGSANNAWEPLMHGVQTQQAWSVRVHVPYPPETMVFLPGGDFLMGDALGDHNNITRPVHQVHLSPFYMCRDEVTNLKLYEILQWALGEGLISVEDNVVRDARATALMFVGRFDAEITFDGEAFLLKEGREAYPAPNMSWFGAVSFCNYRSLMEGFTPCYDLVDWSCDLSENGYRLPTESEWEYAARGGYVGHRFPWGDTNVITHSRANYRSDSEKNAYDVSPTQDFHPDYANVNPRSSPVGTFAPNGFDLYDMCGNLLEWTGDWYARYSSSTKTNPVGPATGIRKVVRGGSWYTTAERATVSMRLSFIEPEAMIQDIGFRMVRSTVEP